MKHRTGVAHSLRSASARRRFGAALALTTVIPLLIAGLLFAGHFLADGMSAAAALALAAAGVAAAAAGALLLRPYPINLARMRRHLKGIRRGRIPENIRLIRADRDTAAIEHELHRLTERLTANDEADADDGGRRQEQICAALKVEGMTRMAAGLAHDFNNLLSAILGNISMVVRMLPPESPVKDNARQVEASALKAVETSNLMLIYSERGSFVEEPFSLSELLQEIVRATRSSLEPEIDLALDVPDELPLLLGDPAQMRMAVTHLVANASESIQEGGGRIDVRAGLQHCDRNAFSGAYLYEDLPEGAYLFIEVQDSGCGMTADVRRRMFDPFFSTKLRSKGMGLSIVLGVTRSLGGAVTVASRPGGGTKIRLFLPRERRDDDPTRI